MILLIIGILMFFDYSFSFNGLHGLNKDDSLASSYLMGVLTSVSWAPCYSGYLISLITLLISSSDWAYAVFNILLYCVGFAVTLLVLSILISKIDLEKLISKTKHIPKMFAILVIIGSIYLLIESLKVLL